MRDPVTAAAARLVATRATGEVADAVFDLMRRTLGGVHDANAVQRAQQQPHNEDAVAALEDVIYARFVAGPEFADGLRELIQRLPPEPVGSGVAVSAATDPARGTPLQAVPAAGDERDQADRPSPVIDPGPDASTVNQPPAPSPDRAQPHPLFPASTYPVAWVDERVIHRGGGDPGVYLLAAVIAEGSDVDAIRQAARDASPTGQYHTWRMHHHGHPGTIETMLDVVEERAAWSVVVAHTPTGSAIESARQSCLRQLLTYLDRQKVRDVILDMRSFGKADWDDARQRGLAMPKVNYRDLRTYRHLVTNKEISARMRIQHVPYESPNPEYGLWLADAVVWAAGRAVFANEPQWWFRVADAATILDAVTGREMIIESFGAALPKAVQGEFGPHSWSPSARAMLQQAYPSGGGYDMRHVGPYYAELLRQAVQARLAASTLGHGGSQLASVHELEERIDALARVVRGMRTEQAGGSRQTDAAPSLPAEPQHAVEPEIE